MRVTVSDPAFIARVLPNPRCAASCLALGLSQAGLPVDVGEHWDRHIVAAHQRLAECELGWSDADLCLTLRDLTFESSPGGVSLLVLGAAQAAVLRAFAEAWP